MIDHTTIEYKQEISSRLSAENLSNYVLENIDPRIKQYVESVQADPSAHNLYEILAVLKFLRLLRTYVFNHRKFKKFVKLYESLKFSGLTGRQRYKMTPIQIFQTASILGFYKWEYVGDSIEKDFEGEKEKVEDGKRYQLRRLCREAILFVPRKFSKTTYASSLVVSELLFGDANAQAYTAGNSFKQASICFKEVTSIIKQLDKKRKYFKTLREQVSWKDNKFGKESIIECLSGSADTKDGLNASLVVYDEFAQATYVRGHSQGAELLNVLTSSMGTRTEPLTIIITTAGRNPNTPFAVELQNAKAVLREEYYNDSQFASLFMPDAWEQNTDSLSLPSVWRKCNPHIGITVQESYYHDRWTKASHDAEAMIEFKTKLVNIFVEGTIKQWISASLARSLQTDFNLAETKGKPWCMVGMDLSISDDLSAVVYNIYSRSAKKFYIYLDCYIPELTLLDHPNRELYKIWIDNGWMKVCPGAVIDPRMIVNDILERRKYLTILQIGYDAYKSQEVVNSLSSALSALGFKASDVLKPVPQTYGAFTSPVETFEFSAKCNPPRVALSMSPILPYAFGNCYLDEDKMGNKKPLKREQNLKIDPAIATLETFWLYNNYSFSM